MNLYYFLNCLDFSFRFILIIVVYLFVIGFLCYLTLLLIWWSLMLTRFLILFFNRNFGKNKDLKKFVFPMLGDADEEGEQDA